MAVVAIVDKVPHVCMYVTMKKEATHPLCAVCHIFNFNAKVGSQPLLFSAGSIKLPSLSWKRNCSKHGFVRTPLCNEKTRPQMSLLVTNLTKSD